jgi:hypothetical protein
MNGYDLNAHKTPHLDEIAGSTRVTTVNGILGVLLDRQQINPYSRALCSHSMLYKSTVAEPFLARNTWGAK